MKNTGTNIKNNQGSMMIFISTMLLALLIIISIAASKTALIEARIAGNEVLYHNNFYCAEGAVIESVDVMETLERVDVDAIDWLMNEADTVAEDRYLCGYWTEADRDDGDARPESATLCAEHTEFMTVHHGVFTGSSLDMSKPTKHAYSIYGYSHRRGSVMIKVGYAKAF